ncbi:hypothetical protein E4U58_002854 [Claviceps cyperi]|nr:hypothetical protein E4U58_002854 [Claviceps cyperi]
MDQRNDAASEISQEDRPSTETFPITSTGTFNERDLPEVFQKKCFIKYLNERVDASDDIDHENATTIEANNRVAFKLQEYTEQGLTNIELRRITRARPLGRGIM